MKTIAILIAATMLVAPTPAPKEKEVPKQIPSAPMVCAFYCGMQENGTVGCQVPPIFCRPVQGMVERFEEHLKEKK